MMKIVASLVILGLCANVAFGAVQTPSSQSSAFTSSLLNSSIYTVYSAGNTSDAAWDSSCATCGTSNAAVTAGVYSGRTWFVPGATNDTSYVFGVPTTGYTTATAAGTNPGFSSAPTVATTSSIKKRTINNTIVAWGNDTKEYAVVGDSSVSTSIMGSPSLAGSAVAPGYLGLVTSSWDSATSTGAINQQVYFTIVNGASGSANTQTVTKNADVTAASTTAGCTETTVGAGNVWYDIGAGAFFFTYWINVQTQDYATSGTACTGTTATAAQAVKKTTIYLGGYYLNGTAYFTTNPSVAAATAGNTVSSLIGGGDNWLNSTNIYIAYQDSTASPTIVYSSKTTKASATSALGSFSQLIKSTTTGTTTVVNMNYAPVSVWASNYTYGITVGNETDSTTSPAAAQYTIGFVTFLNGSSTGVDSGLTVSGTDEYAGFWGWPLNTGFSILAGFVSSTSPYPTSYQFATYYANGTANLTAATIGSLTYGAPQLYEDANGTMWMGWQDVDTTNSGITYAGYLAKLQGQINVPSGASILSAISAFFALFLAAIFVF